MLLAIGALILLGHAAIRFSQDLMHASMPAAVIGLLDRLLLVLMTIELLYTVQVSFREHALAPEPFLVVGLVAVTRRILVLTAGYPTLQDRGGGRLPGGDDRAGGHDADDRRAGGVVADAQVAVARRRRPARLEDRCRAGLHWTTR